MDFKDFLNRYLNQELQTSLHSSEVYSNRYLRLGESSDHDFCLYYNGYSDAINSILFFIKDGDFE